ncbi:protein of unknown function [Pararobbsia alpina]
MALKNASATSVSMTSACTTPGANTDAVAWDATVDLRTIGGPKYVETSADAGVVGAPDAHAPNRNAAATRLPASLVAGPSMVIQYLCETMREVASVRG